jgi:hypothetical protein
VVKGTEDYGREMCVGPKLAVEDEAAEGNRDIRADEDPERAELLSW